MSDEPIEVQLQIDRLLQQIKFQHEVISECHELTDPRSKTPLQDAQMIRIKTSVALRAAEKSGFLP
jgi:hypothetical protein